MTFINEMMLIGLAAVAVPILIHLLHRGRAKVVHWGAMQFLLASLASRNRRILLEELILMAVRCLCLALLALAMARPFLPNSSAVPWAVVLPSALAAALSLAVATVMWSRRVIRWVFLAVSLTLIAVAAGGSLWEHYYQENKWSLAAGQQDIAIVIDASMSMGLEYEGKTNFARAIDEARSVIASARVGDAISVIMAGAVARPIVATPLVDRKEVMGALDTLTGPTSGPAGVLEAFNAAASSLASGNNPAKSIIFITDLQNVGWDMRSVDRWRYLASGLKALPSRPRIIVRGLHTPAEYRNAAIASIGMSRKVVGSDRDVTIDVKVLNSGTTRLREATVTVSIDGVEMPAGRCGATFPNSAETVSFSHRFVKPGPHVICASINSKDDLPGDNILHRVVNVIEKLPVLIVDGSPSVMPLEGAAAFIDIALAPKGASDVHHSSIGPQVREASSRYLVEPTIVGAADVASVSSFDDYRLIILANVSRLPRAVAKKIAMGVHAGTGLLVAPGDLARPEFYNQWKDIAGAAVMPATLGKRNDRTNDPVSLAPRTFNHPSLTRLAESSYSTGAIIKSYWSLGIDSKDVSVRIGARLLDGAPFLVERRLGQGHVLMTAIALDRHDSNLRTLQPFFVPFVHEMVYFLAAGLMAETNVAAGSEVALEIPLRRGAKVNSVVVVGDPMTVTTPSARQCTAWVTGISRGRLRVSFSGTDEPGLYRLAIPGELSGELSQTVADREAWPFVVEGSAEEGRLVVLTNGEMARARRYGVELLQAHTPQEMVLILRGHMPGDELWRVLVLIALAALLVEIFLTRWIAVQRKSGSAAVVKFAQAPLPASVSTRRR